MRPIRLLAALLLVVAAVGLGGLLAIAVTPLVRSADIDDVRDRVAAQPRDVVTSTWSDESVADLEVQLAVGLSAAGVRTLWCETVGHAAIAQRLSITMWQGGRRVVAPSDCGVMEDGLATTVRAIAPWLLVLVISCLLVLVRPWLLTGFRRSIERGHPRWAGCCSSVAACVPVALAVAAILFTAAATQSGFLGVASVLVMLAIGMPSVALVVAALTGAAMGPRLVRPAQAIAGWPFIRLSIAEVVLGAVIAGAAFGVATGWAAGVATGVAATISATLAGLAVFGLPMLLATGSHILVWYWLLAPATDPPRSARSVASSVGPGIVTPA
ncbi:MAG: hypothetical protein KF809_08485 [Chloroflexi bacterium]|nr:hypothetical protein [Chloroflexota bacterium]